MPRSSSLLVAALVLAASLAALAPSSGADADLANLPPCDGFRVIATQGPSCPIPGGWRVLLRDGSTVDTHGPDAANGPGLADAGNVKATAPACVADPSAQFHSVVVYAHAADRPDRSAEMTPVLRGMVEQANGFLRQESMELGATARYKFRCDGPNAVSIVVGRLPTADADTTFATLISDLRAQGLNSPYAKYWVWYDGTRGTLYGQGQIFNNDKLTSSNGNAKGNAFSVVWGLTDPQAFVHESAHTMGAVQLGAPNSSGAWHCVDGLDVMCYFDSPESAYEPGVCTDRVHLDCNHDDYFHPDPAPGSYLATHWNMAHRYNRFLDFGRANEAPVGLPVSCVPAVVDFDQPTVCRAFADDDSDGIAYWVSVDGGPSVRHPATGWMIAGHALVLGGSWPGPGTHTFAVTAFDDAKKSLSGQTVVGSVRVGCALERTGNLTGLGGAPDVTAVAWERGVPRACAGQPYALGATMGADADLCWYDAADVPLGCSTALGEERGSVPANARSAKVSLKAGAQAVYTLRAG